MINLATHLEFLLIAIPFFIYLHFCSPADDVCFKKDEDCVVTKRYFLYDVNGPEGFNLRRDVYLRLAVLAHKMKKSENPKLNNFRLVLPPWSHLVHWEYSDVPEHVPWGLYFDVDSLKAFAPVVEMSEFFGDYPNKYRGVEIDEVYTLQHFEDMFSSGNFEDRMQIDDCQKKYVYSYFYYSNITAKNVQCLSYHGPATQLTNLFMNTSANVILINHAEVVLHDFFGSRLYWQARRSMRFSKALKEIAADFRRSYLNSTDDTDNTHLPESWTDEKQKYNVIGGPYLAVHLRRRDFVRSRSKESPSIKSVSQQIKEILQKLDLNYVFIATDATEEEFQELFRRLKNYTVLRFTPNTKIKAKYKDGGTAIIDQVICSYARYFIGTHESTFTFRIQEEREILGFSSENTYNVFCRDNVCPKPSVWKIVY